MAFRTVGADRQTRPREKTAISEAPSTKRFGKNQGFLHVPNGNWNYVPTFNWKYLPTFSWNVWFFQCRYKKNPVPWPARIGGWEKLLETIRSMLFGSESWSHVLFHVQLRWSIVCFSHDLDRSIRILLKVSNILALIIWAVNKDSWKDPCLARSFWIRTRIFTCSRSNENGLPPPRCSILKQPIVDLHDGPKPAKQRWEDERFQG